MASSFIPAATGNPGDSQWQPDSRRRAERRRRFAPGRFHRGDVADARSHPGYLFAGIRRRGSHVGELVGCRDGIPECDLQAGGFPTGVSRGDPRLHGDRSADRSCVGAVTGDRGGIRDSERRSPRSGVSENRHDRAGPHRSCLRDPAVRSRLSDGGPGRGDLLVVRLGKVGGDHRPARSASGAHAAMHGVAGAEFDSPGRGCSQIMVERGEVRL